MSTPHRPNFATPFSVLAAMAIASLVSLQAIAADSDAPLKLGTEHVGMTSEGIAEAEHRAQTEHVVQQAIQKSEWTDDDLGEGRIVFECPEPAAVAADATATVSGPVVKVHASGVEGYESCVEVAIRSGNGFTASSSVCRTLYPEDTAPMSAESAPTATGTVAPPPVSAPPVSAAPTTEDVWEAAAGEQTASAPPGLEATPTQY